MLKIKILIFLLLSVLYSKAQLLDSLQSYFHYKPKLVFRFDSKTSFISSNSVSIWGANVGFDFNNKIKTGLGYYILYSDYNKNISIHQENKTDTFVNAELHFSYGGIFFEYIYYTNEKWEMSFPLHIGFGASTYKYLHDNMKISVDRKFMALYEANICAQYKITYWFGVGGGIGYRLMLINNHAIKDSFNAPIYALKVNIFFGEIYKHHFWKQKSS